jgi:hypothetical protein
MNRCRTIVTVQPDGAVLMSCERCDYSAEVAKEIIARPLGDCLVGTGLLRVIYHVEHVENGVPAHQLAG